MTNDRRLTERDLVVLHFLSEMWTLHDRLPNYGEVMRHCDLGEPQVRECIRRLRQAGCISPHRQLIYSELVSTAPLDRARIHARVARQQKAVIRSAYRDGVPLEHIATLTGLPPTMIHMVIDNGVDLA